MSYIYGVCFVMLMLTGIYLSIEYLDFWVDFVLDKFGTGAKGFFIFMTPIAIVCSLFLGHTTRGKFK